MIDLSSRSALASCDHCHWRAIRANHDAARDALARHEADCHPGTYAARDAARQADTRRRSK